MKEIITLRGKSYRFRHTVPVRKDDSPELGGLRYRDARDQAQEEARNIRRRGKGARIIPNAEGFGIYEEVN